MVTDEMVEAAYEAVTTAMPHEALVEIGAGELDRVVRAALTAALATRPFPTGEKVEAIDAADHKARLLDEQIGRLADFIMAEVPGEPSRSEGAVDTAIRWMRAALATRRPSPTGEKVEAEPEPVAWQRSNADGTWSGHFFSDRTSVPEWESWGFTSRPVYSAETVAALVAERDEARAKVEHFRTMYNTTVQTCQNRGRALAAANARVERLERALRRIAEHPDQENGAFRADIARAALTGGEDDR